jgi:hypothetical protein
MLKQLALTYHLTTFIILHPSVIKKLLVEKPVEIALGDMLQIDRDLDVDRSLAVSKIVNQ